ncbi:MAG: hypothetical protein C0616_06075 [Desulfuromonas sp.]|nr:MAG: hypothetical protein C0616_06075 [Desulfuromonas sp.]
MMLFEDALMADRPQIADYLDYREFLRDMFAFCKATESHFSHRFLAGRAGFSSPNFLQLVIEGKRNLSPTSVRKVAKGFGLTAKERDYLECLVLMNQAQNHWERDEFYRKLLSLKKGATVRKLRKAEYDYFSNWYVPAIREVAVWEGGRLTPSEMAQRLDPAITSKQAEKALGVLVELNLIEQDEQGRWQKKDAVVTTGAEVQSLCVANFHREMIPLGSQAIERFNAEERDISALTLTVSRDRLPALKKKIVAFRKELLEMARAEEGVDQVVQVNIQAFPLARALAVADGVADES